MNKSAWISTGVISLLIPAIINFNAGSVAAFLIGSLIMGVILFGVSALIIRMIQKIKQRSTKKAVLFGVLSVSLVIILFLGYLVFFASQLCFTAITPAHFRTNILTGQCDFGGYASCAVSDPWYYKPGCDVPDGEKIEVFKKTGWYEQAIRDCKLTCGGSLFDKNLRDSYCTDRISHGEGISCNDLIPIPCDEISCD